MQEMLSRLRARSAGTAETGALDAATASAAENPAQNPSLGPNRALGQSMALPMATGPVAGAQSIVGARLAAKSSQAMPETGLFGAFRVINKEGRFTAVGPVRIENAADLERLRGVQVVEGKLEILESALGADALAALSSLETVAGDLAVEGNRKLGSLEPLKSLREVEGNLYLGFNDALATLDLPRLERVGGALILEGQPDLSEIRLDGLKVVGSYFDIHENDSLARVSLASLATVGGELSVRDNPELDVFDAPALHRLGAGTDENGNKNRMLLASLPAAAH